MGLIRYLLISIIFLNPQNEVPKDKSLFISPVRIPLALSASFGELRTDHFHSGLDIKTQGVTGKKVVAAAEGYIYRISVAPGGFGKALYLRHPSGYSTVYGHLDSFTPAIEDYVKLIQYERKSFAVSLFPPKDKFTFVQGDLIGYSGNSGSSGGPHLHFEVRKSENEVPVNPLLFEFGANDNIRPVIERLVIYPINQNSLINKKNSIKRINVAGGDGNYYIPSSDEIKISGIAGFGIKTYDLLDDSYNKCAIYTIELRIDSITRFRYVMDEFAFSETRYINSHIDYESFIKDKTYIQRTFILPNDKLSVYRELINRGIYDFTGSGTHYVEIIVTDTHNNKSRLAFTVAGEPLQSPALSDTNDNGMIIMPYTRANRFRAENITINIPAGALYDTTDFSYQRNPGTPEMYSDIHNVHNMYTPLHRAFTISIKPSVIPAGKESKMLIVQTNGDNRINALNTVMSGAYLTAEPNTFGVFYVGIDTVAPVISANGLRSGADLSARNELRIKINDDLSGIKSYEPILDGKWALFEYDQKNNVIIYEFDPERIAKGTMHKLELKVTDNKENQSLLSLDFRW